MKSTTRTTHTHDVTLQDGTELTLELPIAPDSIMEFKEPLFLERGDELILGYLSHDSDCANPLKDCDGMGHIYEARRHGSTLEQYEEARGYSQAWGGPNLDLVDEDKLVAEALKRIQADPVLRQSALEHCLTHWERQSYQLDDEVFIIDCLNTENELTPVIDLDAIRLELWKAGRANGTIGDKHAVLLDVYEHGQTSYSVSGGGVQCQFDTAAGGAVWVPDEDLRGELEALPEDQQAARARALAQQACKVYTDWCNGNCFGTIVVTYSRDGEELTTDACWGYIGDDDAYTQLKAEFPKGEA